METPGETAAKTLAWQVETQTSVEVEVRTTITMFGANANIKTNCDAMIDRYVETGSGQRFYEIRGVNGQQAVFRNCHFGDRGKFTDVTYVNEDTERQQVAILKNTFYQEETGDRRQVPPPLQYFFVGRKPLHEALERFSLECTGRARLLPSHTSLARQEPRPPRPARSSDNRSNQGRIPGQG